MMINMGGKYAITFFALLQISSCITAWQLPELPSGKRTQYFLLHDDGGYKYGYDTGNDHFAKQASDANNEVAGHYVYQDANGHAVDVKYTAGVNGFIAEDLDGILAQARGPSASPQGYAYPTPTHHPSYDTTIDGQSNTGDASYSFNIDTDTYKREETSDAEGNVQGRYSYSNEAGAHDLSYVAGTNTGFVATSGSLSKPNGLLENPTTGFLNPRFASGVSSVNQHQSVSPNADGSYSFEYSTDDQSRQESSDANGNVQGRYSYTDETGSHDLSYVAGAATGFQPTGGNLADPAGLKGKSIPLIHSAHPSVYTHASGKSFENSYTPVLPNTDGSYYFEYSSGDQSRQESSDSQGSVKGRYSYTNEAGTHDLNYVAGSQTGFMPTGGSLAIPNGLAGKSAPTAIHYGASSGFSSNSYTPSVPNADGSYAFQYSTGDSSRQESSDSNGNVQGRYSFTNEAGNHDLSYTAGSDTGFQPTGGSLATPNGISPKFGSQLYQAVPPVTHTYIPPTTTYSGETTVNDNDDQANTGDASYNFSIDTDEYKREESSDAQGNVKGSYSYKNEAGNHDLSFVAGSESGFVPTGGSLAQPNGLEGKNIPTTYSYTATPLGTYIPPVAAPLQAPKELDSHAGDASYSFSIDTDEYKRKEASDAMGNVAGMYSYKNEAGSHDLSYTAGSRTGFALTGGSLAVPNGLSNRKFAGPFASPEYLPPLTKINTNKANNVVLKQYYPSKSQSKYGYIYESS